VSRGYSCCSVTRTATRVAEVPCIGDYTIVFRITVCIIDYRLAGVPLAVDVSIEVAELRVWNYRLTGNSNSRTCHYGISGCKSTRSILITHYCVNSRVKASVSIGINKPNRARYTNCKKTQVVNIRDARSSDRGDTRQYWLVRIGTSRRVEGYSLPSVRIRRIESERRPRTKFDETQISKRVTWLSVNERCTVCAPSCTGSAEIVNRS